ncbi:alanyl-tRNA editing protein [Clostridium paraputrificum]|uniref:alanyl-tRNA editing protein n=1 Tax=Clostridium TaxID=1485 RepID=UPI003D34A2DB
MTEKLFYTDQYIKEFEANIVKITEKDNKYLIELDRTAFFPGGGGQCCDLGFIDGNKVIDMIEEKNRIYHILEIKPKYLNNVKCSIDWNRRLDGMQQHLGQHLLSGCFYDLFNINTCGIHIGDEISTVDIVGYIEEEKIREVEKMANKVISDNHKVTFSFANRKEARSMGLRRDLATNDSEIRIVKIEDIDINACCGIHPSSTLELQLIKIKKWEKHKGNTRIEYIVGRRAIEDYLNRDKILDDICNELSTGAEEAVKSLKNLKDNYNLVRSENSKIKVSLSEFETKELISEGEKIKEVVIIKKIYDDEDMKYLNKLANKLVEEDNRIALFATKDKEKANLLFACSKNLKSLSMGNLLKDAITLIDGRGGGSNLLAQGGGKNISNLDNAIDYAIRRLRDSI